jgi:hypothetical protein
MSISHHCEWASVCADAMFFCSYAFDGHSKLHGVVLETPTLQFIGKWSSEVLEFIPYVYSLKMRNMLKSNISTYSGMAP